ncbi:MAG TPA: lysoplasmalogenase [Chitinophagaceae bacterium]|nr:lysoplasmalogenase [Chitinophagaceae bacterium]
MKKIKNGFIIFWLVAIIDLIIIATHNISFHFYIKPLLMPTLIATFLFANGWQKNLAKLIIMGLFFSFAGDVFLLWDKYFIPGLLCFLTTHILYIVYFVKTANKSGWYIKKHPFAIFFPLIYVASLVWLLFPFLDALKIPVIIYALVIGTMFLSTINLYKKVKSPTYIYFISGAIFFVLSDSLLAINKFYTPFSYAGVTIMLTYCTAQYLIVKGAIQQL